MIFIGSPQGGAQVYLPTYVHHRQQTWLIFLLSPSYSHQKFGHLRESGDLHGQRVYEMCEFSICCAPVLSLTLSLRAQKRTRQRVALSRFQEGKKGPWESWRCIISSTRQVVEIEDDLKFYTGFYVLKTDKEHH